MNKKAAMFATLTVMIMIAFTIGYSMRKDQILKENNLLKAGDSAKNIIDLTLKEEEIQFFIEKSAEAAAYKSLLDMGAKGGFFTKKEECGNAEGYTLFEEKCSLPIQIEQEFLQYFRNHFDKILAEYNLTGFSEELELDEKNNLIVKITGMADISTKGIRYQPEFETNFKVNFDFNDFSEVLNQASDCVQKERIKGQTSNLLFEDCRNDPSFDWVIKENEKIVFFDASTKDKFEGFGPILIRLAIPL